MTLIPALMSVLDHRAWWLPRWLDRLVPNVDLEGASLENGTPADSADSPDEKDLFCRDRADVDRQRSVRWSTSRWHGATGSAPDL